MSTPDQQRIEAERMQPRILQLWWALQPLQSTIRFMNTGAHPDDETSAMLAALGLRDGFSLSYACSTRGEGGQNDIGTEAGAELGALRTAEMERAAEVLNMRLYWLSEGPEDTIFDFGFSKSGSETLGKWTESRTLARFVDIIRTEKPDIICPTFLDIPGQHGHHRAMTEAAHKVMTLGADPDFKGSSLPVWQVAKLFLPAWSGAGQSYDDDLPPPPATLTVSANGSDPVSGWSYERIGQHSRACHRTQAMGRWVRRGDERDWPLHLGNSHVDGPDTSLISGLPATVADLGELPGAGPIAADLEKAQRALDQTRTAFPDGEACARAATMALSHIRQALAECPNIARPRIAHRLAEKEIQLAQVIRIGLGVEITPTAERIWVRPGETITTDIETGMGAADSLDLSTHLPRKWSADGARISLAHDAAPHDPYRAQYDPAMPPAPHIAARITAFGVKSETRLPFVSPPVAMPDCSGRVTPAKVLLNRTTNQRRFQVNLTNLHPEGSPKLILPDGWSARTTGQSAEITPPEDIKDGLYHLPLTIDGKPAQTLHRITYPHITPTLSTRPAGLAVRVLKASVPDIKVGYVGAGNDRIGHWLWALGIETTDLSDADLQSDATLAGLDTIVIGIFALRFRASLNAALPRLHNWIEAGGRLLTLYHRPWDNWDPDTTPPRHLEIGQPSLRWRVTDETAEITHLLPDHAILNRPNAIGPQDWAGWQKERGLYFAKSWDKAYQPLLSMADPDEPAHQGALLAADIGRGQHVHTSLILHHQMENLVPGAFRLMANLIAKPD